MDTFSQFFFFFSYEYGCSKFLHTLEDPVWCVLGRQSAGISPPSLHVFAVVFLMAHAVFWDWLSLGVRSFLCRVQWATGERAALPALSERIRNDVPECWLLLCSRAIFKKKVLLPLSLCLPTTHLVLNTFFRPDFVQTQCCSASIKRQFSTQRIKSSC